MRRRDILAFSGTTLVGFAGCFSSGAPVSFDIDTSIETQFEPIDTEQAAAPVEVSGAVIDDPSGDTPWIVELTVQNDSPERITFVGNSSFFPFQPTPANDAASALFPMPGPSITAENDSYPEDWDRVPDEPDDDCWRLDSGEPYVAIPSGALVQQIAPGGTIRGRYAVLRDFSSDTDGTDASDDCYPAGQYEYIDEVTVEGRTYEWTVTLVISN